MPPPSEIKTWTRTNGGHFLCTTDPQYIDLAALNSALDSEMIWWAGPLDDAGLRTMVDYSLCISLYRVTEPDHVPGALANPMIGFARVVTDYVTFAYLTDVYVLPEHQGRGLGVWMMECLQEMLEAWPALRRVMLMATSEHAIKMYERVLGMKSLGSGVMTRIGPGASAAFRDAETPN